ncbi:hypothetical protein BKA56DRAFT_203433 [Ilyonectria sp. MPI-CAGE-AT-0026]|nr:hypothetical protein BKA56DRAFT_203433 [Ilyonectria sp. MPI-CAGE-AT-0026]
MSIERLEDLTRVFPAPDLSTSSLNSPIKLTQTQSSLQSPTGCEQDEQTAERLEGGVKSRVRLVIWGLLKSRFPGLEDTVVSRSRTITVEPHSNNSSGEPEKHRSITKEPGLKDSAAPDEPLADQPHPPMKHTRSASFRPVERRFFDFVSVDDVAKKYLTRQASKQNLQPYVCLSNCNEPYVFFASFQEWRDHMERDHGENWVQPFQIRQAWYCDIDPCSPTHTHTQFSNAAELQAHIEQEHDEGVPAVRVASMIRRNTVRVQNPNFCPLCWRDVLLVSQGTSSIPPPQESETTGQLSGGEGGSEGQEGLQPSMTQDPSVTNSARAKVICEHIARHLEGLVMLSVRYARLKDAPGSPQEWSRGVTGSGVDGKLPSEAESADHSSILVIVPESERSSWQTNLEDLPPIEEQKEVDSPLTTVQPEVVVNPQEPPSPSRSTSPVLSAGLLEDLLDYIHDGLVESVFDSGNRFLPVGVLNKVVHPANVRRELERYVDDHDNANDLRVDELVIYVVEKARRIFAILVYLERIDLWRALSTFKDHGLTDKHLPIPRDLASMVGKGRGTSREEITGPLKAFRHSSWRRVLIMEFYHVQWMFLVPVFKADTLDAIYRLDAKMILPFVKLGKDTKLGAFSNVYAAYIHPDHFQGFPNSHGKSNVQVALKELRMDSQDSELRETFEKEIYTMKELRSMHHDHMINSVATVFRGESRYLMFPWADGGNLRDLWMAWETGPEIRHLWPPTSKLILEVVQQLRGLASALNFLHENNFRHGDVKPENILIFKDKSTLGTLKLGDLGLAKAHNANTTLRRTGTLTKYGTIRYEAPEAEVCPELPRSRRYDIWSIGCVLFEFVIWLVYGQDGLRDLNTAMLKHGNSDAFYIVDAFGGRKKPAEHHPVVSMWLEAVCNDEIWTDGTVLGDLVRIVRDHLLVIEVPTIPTRRAPPPNEQDIPSLQIKAPTIMEPATSECDSAISARRADAKLLEELLQRICERCEADESYLFPSQAIGRVPQHPPAFLEDEIKPVRGLASSDPMLDVRLRDYRTWLSSQPDADEQVE